MYNTFGSNYVAKKQVCVVHVYKSLATPLRYYKKSMKGRRPPYSKGIGGKGPLTDK